ncbi:urease accessory protein UreE [Psychrobacter aquaticus]|uniref:Urease accessory protein UreE n=1 Tax=Psychrobacter aquaticus CMS 56 TaxID=1354303 RepID=U4T1W8_9GAMM|nr:urease accessory protein UreE [Psychrobacter aquaticus]ERL54390.1 Urease accessory protein UreE [Psychrobacter aquaticus CMS 56]
MNIYTQRLDQSTLSAEQQAIIDRQKQAENFLYLDFDTRQRSRFKAETQHHQTIGVDLPRTETIKNSSVLADHQGNLIQIMAANQALIEVTADNGFDLMKSAYHLGNRHVPLMITPKALYFEPDHVLEAMLHQLGLHTQAVQAPFEPETGAYKGDLGGHSHGHNRDHNHAQENSDNHQHNHSDAHSHHEHTHD